MTQEQFHTLALEIGRLAGIKVEFIDDTVAKLGDHDELELHPSGLLRRTRYVQPDADPRRIANAIKLEARDRIPSRVDLDRLIDSLR
jgi:hypothetical protein